jgi:hypothetical protein
LDEIQAKTIGFTDRFLGIRRTVAEAFEAQLKEYITAVDGNENFGIDSRITVEISQLTL